jgi:hypothetical protein
MTHFFPNLSFLDGGNKTDSSCIHLKQCFTFLSTQKNILKCKIRKGIHLFDVYVESFFVLYPLFW